MYASDMKFGLKINLHANLNEYIHIKEIHYF